MIGDDLDFASRHPVQGGDHDHPVVLERRRLQFVLYNQGRITSRVLLAEGERIVGAPLDRVLGGALVGFLLDRPVPDTPEQFFLTSSLLSPRTALSKVRLASYETSFPGLRCIAVLVFLVSSGTSNVKGASPLMI
ncbi:hypothetical protein JCM18909_2292 [Cutibacterium acnes JCM 18909]|nr:hypothetical protein JCM18909_2292 [Cutibacterium acnes JCM 18909]